MTKYRKRCKTHTTQTGDTILYTNHKGFSLVELIVVVAIMAVLVGVLAPQYLRYVEKTRLQKDNTAIAEIAEAIKIAATDETVYAWLCDGNWGNVSIGYTAVGDKTITFNVSKTDGKYNNPLQAELSKTIGASFSTTSNTYYNSTIPINLYVKVDADGVVKVFASGWYETVDGTYTTYANPKNF